MTGEFIITSGSLPASSDADKFFPIFTATTQPVNITFVQYYGGDSGEYANLVLVPPTVVLDGTTGAGDIPGTISMTPAQYLAGGTWTIDKPGTLGADNGGRGTSWWGGVVIPPFYQIAIRQDTANTAAWEVTVGGFVLGD